MSFKYENSKCISFRVYFTCKLYCVSFSASYRYCSLAFKSEALFSKLGMRDALLGLKPLTSVDPSLYVTATRIEDISLPSSRVNVDVGESGGVSKGLYQ